MPAVRLGSALCPSSRCEDGATLIGIVLPSGRVAFSSSRLEVDEEFVNIARAGRSPEKRFRFASACAKHGCRQWSNERCGVIDRLIDQRVSSEPLVAQPKSEPLEAPRSDAALPACSIRSECRWFQQAGREACVICPDVITDMRSPGEEAPH
jgi:hypothetical protein